MVKKASELRSIRDLAIEPRTASTLINRGYDPDEVVRLGRNICHLAKTASCRPMWQDELIEALDSDGYIRHDIDARTFGVISIYKAIFDGEDNEEYRDMLSFTNEFYERMRSLDDENISEIRKFLKSSLDWEEIETIELHFRLIDGTSWRTSNIAKHIGVDSRRVAQIEGVAIRKLRREKNRKRLPKICLG